MQAANDPKPSLPPGWRRFLMADLIATEAANDNAPRTIDESVALMKAAAAWAVVQRKPG